MHERMKHPTRHVLVLVSVGLTVLGLTVVKGVTPSGGAVPSTSTAGGLSVFVGYAEDKENQTPNPAAFPVPWAGAPNTTFLGGSVPGQAACGTLPTCYDTGAIRLDNPGRRPVTVSSVSVDDHSSLVGGMVFNNLWGSFTVPPGQSVILAANPPGDAATSDDFDTSGFPPSCTPVTVPPTVTITTGFQATTLVDSTHVLDTGGVDVGQCSPKMNESIPWRPIGAPGKGVASLSLAPATTTATAGVPATATATLLDGSGTGIPNAAVHFSVTSGPDAGVTGTAVTSASGIASFTYSGQPGEDLMVASVTTVGTFSSNPARIVWVNGSTQGWSATDIGGPAPAGGQSFAPISGTWTVSGGGAGLVGTADQLHYVSRIAPSGGGVAAKVSSLVGGGGGAGAGVMLRTDTTPGSPFYSALVTNGGGVVVQARTTRGGVATTMDTYGGAAPTYVWVGASGTTLSTYTSTDGYVWTAVPGSVVPLGLGASPLGGLAVTSGTAGLLATATMTDVLVTASPPAPLPPLACPSPWSCADIGSPAVTGTQSLDPNTGTWSVSGSGTDITGTADQFRFVWQTQTGDGSISADVAAQSNTSSQAKAGVMLRLSTDPASPYYGVFVSPGAGIKVQERSTQGGNTTKLANPVGVTPAYLQVTRLGDTYTASTSTDGVTWTPVPGSTFTIPGLGPTMLAGLAVTSHNAAVVGTATMENVQGTEETCPSPWSCADIGSPALAGSQYVDLNTGTWSVSGSGTDITGTADQFRFVWQTQTGDGSISADVAAQSNTSSQAKAGVMLRLSTDPASPYYGVFVSPGAGIKVQERSTQGGTRPSWPTRSG